MSYEVFTLKYRPKTFADVVGQRAVADTLERAVVADRVANAYLFCGSRGVGKTSMARILAKALNCPRRSESGEPCNACEVCEAISAGDDIDVIEIDGASNRGIDDVREIRDSAGYLPSRSPFKVYIIDEVHMLTIQAFNALLKVLEEPPPHVKFIFATTDPNNLPDTILSRCQRHEFRRIGEADIVGRLRDIADREGLEVDDATLAALAQKSQGGLRDSVSALDQVVSYAGTTIALADVEAAIGLLPREHLEALYGAVARGDAPGVLGALRDAFTAGFDPRELLDEMIGLMRETMVFLADPERYESARDRALFETHVRVLPMDRVLYALKLLLVAAGDLKRGGHERVQVELVFLKAARSTELLPVAEILERLKEGAPSAPPAAPRAASPAAAAPPRAVAPDPAPARPAARPAAAPGNAAAPRPAVDEASAPARPPLTLELVRARWSACVDAVRRRSAAVGVALAKVAPRAVEGRRVVLAVPAEQNFVFDQLSAPEAHAVLSEAIGKTLENDCAVAFVRAQPVQSEGESAPRRSVHEDPAVRKFIQHFDGGVANVESDDGQGV